MPSLSNKRKWMRKLLIIITTQKNKSKFTLKKPWNNVNNHFKNILPNLIITTIITMIMMMIKIKIIIMMICLSKKTSHKSRTKKYKIFSLMHIYRSNKKCNKKIRVHNAKYWKIKWQKYLNKCWIMQKILKKIWRKLWKKYQIFH